MHFDVIFLHAPSVYDFRKKPIFYGPVSDVIPSSPVFEMYPIGFMTISSHLEAAGFRTRIVNIAVQMLTSDKFDAEKRIAGLDADVFAIDLHWMPHAHGAIELAKIVKRYHPNAKVEFGGFTSSYFHQELIQRPEIDLVMRGDTTEVPTVMMMEALSKGGDLSEVPNLTWKDSEGRIHENPHTFTLDSLDDIIFDYGDMMKCCIRNRDIKGALPWYGWDRNPMASVFTVRGCSINCAECGGSHAANARVACRKRPAFRSPEKLAEDIERIGSYMNIPVFIIGDLRQHSMDYAERFLKECKERHVKNHVVIELFNGATPEYFKMLDSSFEGGYTIEFSPDSHDEKVRLALGKGYTNEAIEKTLPAAFRNGCERFDLFYMNGLPYQDRESAMYSARAAKKLWSLVDRDDGLFIYNAPFAPFVDPGSRVFEEPEKWGYRIRARTLEDHRRLLDNPSWKHVLSYETEWMTRDDVAEISYDAAIVLANMEHEAGRTDDAAFKARCERTEFARDLMHRVDAILEIEDPEERESKLWETKEDGFRMMNSTIADKKDLDWTAKPVYAYGPRIAWGLAKKLVRNRLLGHALGLLYRAVDGGYHRRSEAQILEYPHALDRGPAGGADLVLEHIGVLAGLEHHLGRSEHGLGRQLYRVLPGEAVEHSSVGHGVDHHVKEGGGASGYSCYSIHIALGHLHREAHGAQDPGDTLLLGGGHGCVAGVSHSALEDHAAMVGHDPYNLGIWHIRSELVHGESGDYADDGLAGTDLHALGLEQAGHVLGLHGYDDGVRVGHHVCRFLVHADAVAGGDLGAGGFRGGAGDDVLLSEDSFRQQPSDEGLGHFACSDETDGGAHAARIRIAVDKT